MPFPSLPVLSAMSCSIQRPSESRGAGVTKVSLLRPALASEPSTAPSRAPKACLGQTFATAEDASQFLITEQSVCCVPWDDAGACLRFSATYIAKDVAEEDALMAETVARLGRLRLQF